jgi:hypothetical protein
MLSGAIAYLPLNIIIARGVVSDTGEYLKRHTLAAVHLFGSIFSATSSPSIHTLNDSSVLVTCWHSKCSMYPLPNPIEKTVEVMLFAVISSRTRFIGKVAAQEKNI